MKVKIFFLVKETINKTKRQPTEWERTFANDISDKEIISKIYKELIQLNIKEINNTIKIGQRTWIHIFPKKTNRGPTCTRKCLCSTSLIIREMQIKPQWHVTSYLSEWLSSKRKQITSVGKDVEKKEPSYTVGRIVHWCSHYGKHYGDSSKIKDKTTKWSSNFTFVYLPKEHKNTNQNDICIPMFIAA